MEDLSRYHAEGTTLRRCQSRMLDMLVAEDKVLGLQNIPSPTYVSGIKHNNFNLCETL